MDYTRSFWTSNDHPGVSLVCEQDKPLSKWPGACSGQFQNIIFQLMYLFYLKGEFECTKKLVVATTVENDKFYETEFLDFQIDCVDSPTGECPCPCNYQIDQDCSCRDLSDPIRVSMTKTPVKLLYSLDSPAVFNGRPYEV